MKKFIFLLPALLFLALPLFVKTACAESDSAASAIDSKEESIMLNGIKKDNPSYYKELTSIKAKHPQIYRKIISGDLKKQKLMTEIKETNPEVYKKLIRISGLEKKANDLVKLYNETGGNERKAELKNEIRNILSELFELREEKYNMDIRELENQLKTLKNKMAKRNENKEKIILRRLEYLISSGESLDW